MHSFRKKGIIFPLRVYHCHIRFTFRRQHKTPWQDESKGRIAYDAQFDSQSSIEAPLLKGVELLQELHSQELRPKLTVHLKLLVSSLRCVWFLGWLPHTTIPIL